MLTYKRLPWLLGALILIGLALRLPRLGWQPLWWDEGYSVYFATEPLRRMAWLTARDIHPPLYYALLHAWIGLLRSSDPLILRAFSVVVGVLALPLMGWLAALLFPGRPRITLIAVLLLAVNPMHIYYSQEVRIYGLALLLGMAGTCLLWRLVAPPAPNPGGDSSAGIRSPQIGGPGGRPTWWNGLFYVITGLLALYTFYYSALLLFTHLVWATWHFRRNLRGLLPLITADIAITLAYVPWILYTVPKLAPYVANKVASDQDTPLGPLLYIWRHLSAFTSGHIDPASAMLVMAGLVGLIGIAILVFTMRKKSSSGETDHKNAPLLHEDPDPFPALWLFLLIPTIFGFLLNLRLPFFPTGGERVLLFSLPYFLLLLAAGMDRIWDVYHLGKIALVALLVSAAAGIVTFYTTPRYAERDYRPLIGQVVQQGRPQDTFFAIFPWQVGYWRAYTPEAFRLQHGPDALLAGEGILEWSPRMAAQLDAALAHGTVWFPAPLSFGSTLPADVESHLAANSANVVNRWYSETTRLSAWAATSKGAQIITDADFGPVKLLSSSVSPESVASANDPISVTLTWIPMQPDFDPEAYYVSLRLLDSDGHAWASRDYAPLGGLKSEDDDAADQFTDRAGFITPAGLPPGAYTLAVGVGQEESQALLRPDTVSDQAPPLQPLATIQIRQPDAPLPVERLPIQFPLARALNEEGLVLLGHAGATDTTDGGATTLAGTELGVTLFFQNRTDSPPARDLYLSLLDEDGAGVAGWEGWPLPAYATASWPPGALVQVPAGFFLPATVASGEYTLIAGFLDPVTGEKSAPAELGPVSVRQRVGSFDIPPMQTLLSPPVQFGAHAELIGYDVSRTESGLEITLHWRAQQPLLPPHHVFVHLDDADGATIAQDDSPPITAEGAAPTGSWLPGEIISTQHTISLPTDELSGNLSGGAYLLRVGLYNPDGNVRLPVTVGRDPGGDSAELPVDPGAG